MTAEYKPLADKRLRELLGLQPNPSSREEFEAWLSTLHIEPLVKPTPPESSQPMTLREQKK